jgi:group I intron endonuclease
MNTGVYKITNTTNGKCYVGSCADLKRGMKHRWWRHVYKLKRQNHPNPHLQNSWNKYGENSFAFEILEECLPEYCLILEQHYMDTLKPEYNISPTAGNTFGIRCSEETKKKISIANKGHIYHTHGNYQFKNIKTGDTIICAKFELANRYGLDRSSISKVCNKTEKSHHGWVCIGKESSYEEK